ncbi:hypothetical protein SAMN02745121_01937 [Nannocystis exedens]|uniref:Uncharacterized protein n=1 Tax=Nannocystis exedens TaxID=54 RepID=A0A1I1VVM4_9BACT|nr:hypothetical protein [Nannocystis exedens]PCC72819.1 hypothetical protein NAEX_05904 [Nannocystis exedens]SFD86128.1 hypothetical protein SAMN02745121_01937 [Nannocystis exedens]
MRTLIVTMTTLALIGALVSTLAAASDSAGAGPRVTDLEVFRDGLTFVASGSFTAGDGEPAPVLVRARGLVTGSCVDPRARASQPFALPMALIGTGVTRRAGREATFFVRTSPPAVAAAEVCPAADWRVAPTDIEFTAVKLQVGRPGARVLCQFPAVDGRIDDPGCQIDS